MAKGPSQRQLRVGELVRHALVDTLARETLNEPALDGSPVSVTEVRMSPDLKIATCFVAPLGGGDAQPVVKALARRAKFLRGRTAAQLGQLKYMPSFRFLADGSFDEASRIDALLRSPTVARDLDGEGN